MAAGDGGYYALKFLYRLDKRSLTIALKCDVEVAGSKNDAPVSTFYHG